LQSGQQKSHNGREVRDAVTREEMRLEAHRLKKFS
jgi:hypothetical protein